MHCLPSPKTNRISPNKKGNKNERAKHNLYHKIVKLLILKEGDHAREEHIFIMHVKNTFSKLHLKLPSNSFLISFSCSTVQETSGSHFATQGH